MRKSILFLIPTLDRGGAENVLVDLVNNMDQDRFNITVQTLFDRDSQKSRLRDGIEYKTFLYKQFRGNSRLMARIPAKLLYRLIVKERYDIVVSYLEGPTTHIISGCLYEDTRTVTWVHVEMESMRQLAVGFRNGHEAIRAYNKFDRVVFVAESVKKRFEETAGSQFANTKVLYNTIKSDEIRKLAAEETPEVKFSDKEFNIISVGRLIPAKGYDRLVNVCQRLVRDGYKCHMYILGQGAEEKSLRDAVTAKNLAASFTFLGFKNNPYKYTKKANLYVCSSRREGFSTAVTEALIVGTPVITTNVSGMREMLGDNEYGVITDNDEEALYRGIKRLMDDPALLAHYRKKAAERGKAFSTEKTVKAVEEMLLEV